MGESARRIVEAYKVGPIWEISNGSKHPDLSPKTREILKDKVPHFNIAMIELATLFAHDISVSKSVRSFNIVMKHWFGVNKDRRLGARVTYDMI